MKPQLNHYHFGRHRNQWGIWQYTTVTETGSSSTHIMDVDSYGEAVVEVYRLNGWGTPKSIKRQF